MNGSIYKPLEALRRLAFEWTAVVCSWHHLVRIGAEESMLLLVASNPAKRWSSVSPCSQRDIN